MEVSGMEVSHVTLKVFSVPFFFFQRRRVQLARASMPARPNVFKPKQIYLLLYVVVCILTSTIVAMVGSSMHCMSSYYFSSMHTCE